MEKFPSFPFGNFWLTIQNTADRQMRNLFCLLAAFISFPLARAAVAVAAAPRRHRPRCAAAAFPLEKRIPLARPGFTYFRISCSCASTAAVCSVLPFCVTLLLRGHSCSELFLLCQGCLGGAVRDKSSVFLRNITIFTSSRRPTLAFFDSHG
jgi:hypothetical protein